MQWLKVCFILFLTPILAEESSGDIKPPLFSKETLEKPHLFESEMEKATVSYETALLKTIGSLIGLLILVILTIWVLRKMGRAQLLNGSGSNSIKILEKRPLSPKSMLYLIQVGKKEVLISESQLRLDTVMILNSLPEDREV